LHRAKFSHPLVALRRTVEKTSESDDNNKSHVTCRSSESLQRICPLCACIAMIYAWPYTDRCKLQRPWPLWSSTSVC